MYWHVQMVLLGIKDATFLGRQEVGPVLRKVSRWTYI